MSDIRSAMSAAFVRGPRFYEGPDGQVMFVHQLDSRSSIGPRKATDDDIAKHPEAYARMGEEPETMLSPRVVIAAELEPPPEDKVRPYAERRKRAEA